MKSPDISRAARTVRRMAKSDSERGPFGAWLVRERKARAGSGRDGKMTAAEVRAWLIRDRGFGIGESAYAELESGTALPSQEQRRHLTRLFDSEPPNGGGSSSPDIAALIRAMDADRIARGAETAALRALVTTLVGALLTRPGAGLTDDESAAIESGLPDAGPAPAAPRPIAPDAYAMRGAALSGRQPR